MGQKTKGGMWCDTCQRPVMGVKNTHRIRNTLSVGGTFATGGASLVGSKVEGYVCPTCGGRARQRRAADGRGLPGGQASLGTLLVITASAFLWVLVALGLLIVTLLLLPYHLAGWRRRPVGVERGTRTVYRRVTAWVSGAGRRFDNETGRTGAAPLSGS